MALFNWSEKFSVGNEQMDNDHRKLVSLMNAIDGAVLANRGEEAVSAAIEALAAYAANHLTAEERLMEALHYPDLERHRAMHLFFAKEIALLRSAHACGHVVRVDSIVQLMRDWFLYHVFSEDRKYGELLEEKLAGAA